MGMQIQGSYKFFFAYLYCYLSHLCKNLKFKRILYYTNKCYVYLNQAKYFFSENDPMVSSNDKPVPPSILKQPNPSAGKRVRAPMIKQTVSISKHMM